MEGATTARVPISKLWSPTVLRPIEVGVLSGHREGDADDGVALEEAGLSGGRPDGVHDPVVHVQLGGHLHGGAQRYAQVYGLEEAQGAAVVLPLFLGHPYDC